MPHVKFIVAHDTGNPGSTARGNVRYYERSNNEMSASAHIFVDDKEVIECIPALTATPEKAWHVLYNVETDNKLYGFNANDAAIGVEYCFGQKIDADEAYKRYVWVMAYICHKFGLDPSKSIVGHHILDPRRKTDPVNGLIKSNRSYEQLLRDVAAEYNECTGQPDPVIVTPVGERTVKSVVKLNVRRGKPSTRAEIASVVQPGTLLTYVATVEGDAVNGNNRWYQDANGNFFWSGGTVPHESDMTAPQPVSTSPAVVTVTPSAALELTLNRKIYTETTTIGELLVNGKFHCYTLEDKDRPNEPKVFGKTAIPEGKYEVAVTYSNRFKARMPLLLNVPNFEGIRIHTGNTAEHTHGCLLVGLSKTDNKVLQSTDAYKSLFPIIDAAAKVGKCFITIKKDA
jgi:N-acetylmuramoyl-L-alanine amidase